MQFGIPMRWLDPGEHNDAVCYVCKNKGVFKLNRQRRKKFIYKAVPSALLPVTHSDALPVPTLPMRSPNTNFDACTTHQEAVDIFSDYATGEETPTPILMTQEHLHALVKKLKLSKNMAEVLAADLKSLNLLAPGVTVTSFRSRQLAFMPYFTVNNINTFVFCNNIEGLMAEMNIEYNAEDWRIFIDSSKKSLKAVLLYFDNSKVPVPVAYGTGMEESYDSMKEILNVLNYNKHKWRICCDLKVVSFLSGMQGGYVKFGCFLCKWDSRWKGNQYSKRDWEMRTHGRVGEHNILKSPLVPTEKILIPPLHIKLGIVKSFVKALATNEQAFQHLKTLFPNLSEGKIKEGMKKS